jgi:hypothetical protein
VTSEQAAPPNEIGADEIGEDFVVDFRSSVAAVVLDGEAVLLDGDTGAVHTLNPTATLVWQCCDGAARLGEIIDDLADVFHEAERAAIAADVLDLARQMARQGLMQGVRAEPPEEEPHQHDHHDHDDHHQENHDQR